MKKMIEKFKQDRDPQGLNVVVLDCQTEDGGKIMEQILSAPFLAEKRMVVLENFLSATGKGDIQEEMLKRFEEKNLPDSTVLLFYEGELKPKTNVSKKLFEKLSKEKFAQSFDLLTGAKLEAWILQQVKDCGGKINMQAVRYLAENIGSDMWRLSSLVEQLVAYVIARSEATKQSSGDMDRHAPSGLAMTSREISLADVQLFLDEKADDNIFNLVDAIVGGQAKKAYGMIQEQYRKGEDAGYVFAMLLRQFRILLELRDLYEREDNLQSDALAKKLGLHPFVVKKSLPFVKRYTLQNLKDVYQKLLDIDVKTKTGQGDQSLLLDVFVGSVTN